MSPCIGGIVLAAGSGRRFGGPKALADTGAGPWVLRTLRTLRHTAVQVVVVGAAADEVTALLPSDIIIAHNPDHTSGMGSSLIAGLRALPADIDAAVIMLVDLPDVPTAAIDRVIALIAPDSDDGCDGETSRVWAGDGISRNDSVHREAQQRDALQRDSVQRDSLQRDAPHMLARASYHGEPGHPVLIGKAHFTGVIDAAQGDRGARDYLAQGHVILVECGDLASGTDVDELTSM